MMQFDYTSLYKYIFYTKSQGNILVKVKKKKVIFL